MEASEGMIFILDKKTTKNNIAQCLCTSNPHLKLLDGGELGKIYSKKIENTR